MTAWIILFFTVGEAPFAQPVYYTNEATCLRVQAEVKNTSKARTLCVPVVVPPQTTEKK